MVNTLTTEQDNNGSGDGIDIEDYAFLLKYIEPLLNNHPAGLTHQELAEQTSVSTASVSKVKDKLISFCDNGVYALKRRFALSDNYETAVGLLFPFAFYGKIQAFLQSKYVKSVISKSGIHEKICAQSKTYAQYFTKDDTTFIVTIIVDNLMSMKNVTWNFIHAKGKNKQQALIMDMLQTLPQIFSGIRIQLRDEKELEHLLTIRDKFYYWSLQVIEKIIDNLEPVKVLRHSEKYGGYKEAYMYLARHFINNAFEQLTNTIRKDYASQFNKAESYYAIGRFFKP